MSKNGFPNFGGPNVNNLIKQIQMLQKQMQDMQNEFQDKEFEAAVGGGSVAAIANGRKQLVNIKIKPEVVDPDDVEMLQDLVLTACNEALKKVDQVSEEEMKKITAGLNLPNLPGMP